MASQPEPVLWAFFDSLVSVYLPVPVCQSAGSLSHCIQCTVQCTMSVCLFVCSVSSCYCSLFRFRFKLFQEWYSTRIHPLLNHNSETHWQPRCSSKSNLLLWDRIPLFVSGTVDSCPFMIRLYSSKSVCRSPWNQEASFLSEVFARMLLLRLLHFKQWSFRMCELIKSAWEMISSQFLSQSTNQLTNTQNRDHLATTYLPQVRFSQEWGGTATSITLNQSAVISISISTQLSSHLNQSNSNHIWIYWKPLNFNCESLSQDSNMSRMISLAYSVHKAPSQGPGSPCCCRSYHYQPPDPKQSTINHHQSFPLIQFQIASEIQHESIKKTIQVGITLARQELRSLVSHAVQQAWQLVE